MRDGFLNVTATATTTAAASSVCSSSSSSSLIFSIGGGQGRVEAALSHTAGGAGCNDRLFAAEKAREERGMAGGTLAVVQDRTSQAISRVQVWALGEKGIMLCEVGAIEGHIVDWESCLGGSQSCEGGAAASCCWLMCVHSSGVVLHLNISPAAAAAAVTAATTSSAAIPQLIRGFNLAAKLQAMPGQIYLSCAHHISHLKHHTPHITHHTPHITHHTSHIAHHTSHITHHTSHITHHTPQMFATF
jgi:hypothetical protein